MGSRVLITAGHRRSEYSAVCDSVDSYPSRRWANGGDKSPVILSAVASSDDLVDTPERRG